MQVSNIPPSQHIEGQTVSDNSSDRADHTRMCYKQTRCTAINRLPLNQIQRLQKVQNWAARLNDGAMKYSHATPLLLNLHWLLIAVRMEFKILLHCHRAMTAHAPVCIEQSVSLAGKLAALHRTLFIARARQKAALGDKAVTMAGVFVMAL